MSGTAAWWTDTHFEMLSEPQRQQLLCAWGEMSADCAIVTGDISHGASTLFWLGQLAEAFERPIYFVLGNHDFYGTSIASQRSGAGQLCDETSSLVYLTASDVVSLSESTALVGHDGWGDMREGDWETTGVRPPDFEQIDDLKAAGGNRHLLRERLRQLGDEAAQHLARILPEALSTHERVVIATHVPPFREASWYEGRNSTPPWLPFFCCRAVGDVLLAVAERYPRQGLLVLCGHCHGTGDVQIRENLRVLTSGTEPCSPQMQAILEFA